MLKKFRSTDIDVLMSIWKKAYINKNKKVDSEELTKNYTSIRDLLLDKSSDTLLYTEDDEIEGFLTIDKNNKIVLIYVDEKIRREGIGSMLIDAAKRQYSNISVSFGSDEVYKKFFEKNDFSFIERSENDEMLFEWKTSSTQKVSIVYFDDDLDEKYFDKSKDIALNRIDIKDVIAEDKELKSVKNYMKIRKRVEDAFDEKTLLYLNYGNYHEAIDDIIKEIVKIEKSRFIIVVSEPLIIENPRMEGYLKKIEESFWDYDIYKIDTVREMDKDVSVNNILEEKMKAIIKRIEKIAENM